MFFSDREDPSRVLHTDGSKMIVTGSADRKIRFVDIETGRDVGPTIHGHAGSIKSLHLCSKRGFVLSGSYDTSVRRWDIHTATCQKIYRGHMGSVIAMAVHKDMFATGAMDCLCKGKEMWARVVRCVIQEGRVGKSFFFTKKTPKTFVLLKLHNQLVQCMLRQLNLYAYIVCKYAFSVILQSFPCR